MTDIVALSRGALVAIKSATMTAAGLQGPFPRRGVSRSKAVVSTVDDQPDLPPVTAMLAYDNLETLTSEPETGLDVCQPLPTRVSLLLSDFTTKEMAMRDKDILLLLTCNTSICLVRDFEQVIKDDQKLSEDIDRLLLGGRKAADAEIAGQLLASRPMRRIK